MTTVLIGYDGSEGGDRAVRAARAVLAADRALVVCVWEASLPLLAQPGLDGMSLTGATLDPETEQVLDDAQDAAAHRTAAQGVEVARAAGFADATPLALVDSADVAHTLIRVAEEQAVAAIVVGSHGHRGVLSRVLGTTSTSLVRDAACPVLVVPPGAG